MTTPSPKDAYWLGQPSSQPTVILYGSARCGLVAEPATDTAYQAWLEQGFAAWPWPKDESGKVTAAALDGILEAYGLPPTGLVLPTLAQLQTYAGAKAAALLATMRAYTASGVTIKSDASAATLADWLALLQWASDHPSGSTQWVANDFSVTTATAAQIGAIGLLVGPYAQTIYDELATVLGEIASTTITTTAQIDAFGWTV